MKARRRPKPLHRPIVAEGDSLDDAMRQMQRALGIVVHVCTPSTGRWQAFTD
jgi:hypothetical protein